MTKQEHVGHWVKGSDFNWREVEKMIADDSIIPGLFWLHLSLEKLAKALWVQDNGGNTPPFTHNIGKVLAATTLVISPAQARFVQQLNTFQLEGRYEDYRMNLRQGATTEFARHVLQEASLLRQCILNQLP